MNTPIINYKEFDWTAEIKKTVLQSLISSFGLDALMSADKLGGHVDTIHNVRNGVWATDAEKQRYENRGEYNSTEYHSHSNYIETNRRYSKMKKNGELVDGYTGKTFKANDSTDLDHVVSAKEVHNDAGRILAGINGADLANMDENLTPTSSSVNRAKGSDPVPDFLDKIDPRTVNKQSEVSKYEQQLSDVKRNNPSDVNKINELEKKIKNGKKYIEDHQNVDKNRALEKDKKARKAMDDQVNKTYYTSFKFMKNTALAAHNQGLLMAKRQMLGLILAEIWFEIQESVPKLYEKHKSDFTFENFWKDVKETLKNVLIRIKGRLKDIISEFGSGYISGVLSSINTTWLNIFTTTSKIVSKLLRELWSSLVKAVKLLFSNKDNLPLGDLCREVFKILATGISVSLGAMLQQHLSLILKMPFGSEIAGFISAVVSGIMTLGAIYCLERSRVMQKVWGFINDLENKLKTQYQLDKEYYQKVNLELDRYLLELSKIEFNMNPQELSLFADELGMATNEKEISILLDAEIAKRGIELPFESGNMKAWLLKKCQKN